MIETVSPIPANTGINWFAFGAWGSFFTLCGIFLRQWVPLRKQRTDELQSVITAQADEIRRLVDRIDTLERRVDTLRENHEQTMAFERANHEAEISLQRHAAKGTKQILRGLLDLIEVAPDKAIAHAAKMRQRMDEQDAAEIAEAATIRGARIIATGQSKGETP